MHKRVAEFFAGIGLMRLGLEPEGWDVIWANDIDLKKCAMYRHHFGAGSHDLVAGDVHALDSSSLPDLELATASFPCTDLSLAGSRHGLEGTSSSAFWGFIKVLKNLGHRRPPLVLLENVTGFLTSHGGSDFRNALLALNDLGYSVDTFQIDAANFVPQSRQRLFVVGTKTDSALSTGLQDGFLESDVRPAALADFIFTNPDIIWNVRTLPRLPKRRQQLEDIVEDVPLNSEIWWSRERADYLFSQMSPKHRAEAQRMIEGKAWSFATVFRRVRNGRSMAELRNDGIAGCLRTPRGGSGRQILFQAGQGSFHVRLVTPRECARLMGAPQFKIEATLNQALFGFGDAVCVPVIQWIARHYLNPVLAEISSKEAPIPPKLIKAGKISY